ncbi:MAG: FtsQ-type POTRA domain-containing protein, partial [Oscillospiraceae bacterium]|nr:FtsQ-type POTRA domain-containing protein [Oscillospiraceae bacterium]
GTIAIIFFKVSDIKVENSITSMYTGNQISTASGIVKGQNLFSFKKKDVVNRILKNLPYVGEVKVKRRFPGTVLLIISETTDYVNIPYRGGYLIVSLDMKILSDTFVAQEGIPTIYGIVPETFIPGQTLKASDDASLDALVSTLTLINDYGWTGRVTAINARDNLDVYMVYDDRILIRFGSVAKLDYKFELLKETMASKLSDDFSGNINLATPKYVYVSEGDMRFPARFFDIG